MSLRGAAFDDRDELPKRIRAAVPLLALAQEATRGRIAWIDRLGEGMLPTRESVIQEGDLLHLVMREENADRVYEVFNHGPEAD